MKKVLLTGFDPFGTDVINPSLSVVQALHGQKSGEVEFIGIEVPTVFKRSLETVLGAIQIHQPDAVICVGQAGGRTQITPEKVAINLDDARIPDNQGQQPVDEPIVPGGPTAYFSTLPVKRMVSQLRDEHIPAAVSYSAGTFVCNHLFYGVMHELQRFPHIRGGFIHIPYIPQQTTANQAPSMSLEMIIRGIELAAKAAVADGGDLKEVGGTTH